ncbi:DegV family protein [Rothia sp. 32237D007AR]
MRTIALVTDSSVALPDDALEQLKAEGGFSVLELPVTVAGRSVSGVPANHIDAAIALAHAQGEQILTSGGAPGALVDIYEQLAAQGYSAIISMHLSGELSGTCDAARLAARLVDIPVVVIDSLSLAMGLGEPVLRLHRLLAKEEDLEQATALAEELCASTELFFFLPTLDALKRGGRVNAALAMVGQMFQIRPVATMVDGKLHYVERPRSTAKAIEKLAALTEQASSQRAGELPLDVHLKDGETAHLVRRLGRVVAIHYSGNKGQALDFKRSLGSIAAEAVVTPLPAVLSAHSGLGALAAVIF